MTAAAPPLLLRWPRAAPSSRQRRPDRPATNARAANAADQYRCQRDFRR